MIVRAGPPAASDLWLLNSDGSGVTQLTRTELGDNSPSWSPDGTRIAFVSNLGPNGDSNAQIFIVNADGSGANALTNGQGPKWGTTWSPVSKRIGFSWQRAGVWQIYSINADGSDQRRLTSGPRHSLAPAWSPDGRTIAFHRVTGDNGSLITLMDADGGTVRTLAGTGRDYHPAWSPAGNGLAFTSFAGGRGDIFVMDLTGDSFRNLTRSAGQGFDLASWSPDGSWIAFTGWVEQGVQNRELMRRLGVSSILLQSAFLMGPLLLVARRWALPFGSITLVVLLTSVAAAVLKDEYELLPGALVAGMMGDLLLRRFGGAQRAIGLRLFGFGLPAAFYALYFAALTLDEGVDWTVHLWAGAIVIAGVVGLALSYLVWPPGEASYSESSSG